ncbi:MAG: cyanophycin synthetase [Sulfuricellaceae bacterium]|nr:cyanophycin synthetase [Sulfuricellaceae bacterium]
MAHKDIKILKITPLRGPNIWTYRPTLEAWVDIGDLEDFPSNLIPGFYERLSAWLPALIEHHCSIGERGGFLQRVREGTWPAHILEHVTLELQNQAGMQSGFGKARSTTVRGVYKVAVRARHEEVSRACLLTARDLVMAAIEDTPFDVASSVSRLRDMADSLCLGPSTACIVNAATDRNIPSIRLSEGNLMQLGYGCRQRRIWTAETDQTGAIAESIASDKDLTKSLLKSCGVPVPEGRMVDSPEDAWDAAQDVGLPCVLKPCDGNHGRGVCMDLKTRAEVEAAYPVALQEGSGVMVERFIKGGEHRLLIVNGKLAAAARGEEAWVTGDGRSTIQSLIDTQLNSDPRRGEEEGYPLSLIYLDHQPTARLEIERQGYATDATPPEGARILVMRNGNATFDVTDEVHPSVVEMGVLAARIVGLDVAGIDVVMEDISRPLEEQGGAFVEVNAGPSLLMHLKPQVGEPRPVGRAIVDGLFPDQASGRIPVVGIAGSRGRAVVARIVARMLHLSGLYVGLACSDGLYLNQRQVEGGNRANWAAGNKLLINRSVQAAVMENGCEMILAEGLAYDRCQVGVVTGLDADERHPDFYIEEAEHVFNIMRTQVDVVLPDGVAVLNACDARVAEMAPLCDGEVIFFSDDSAAPVLLEHRAKGGRSVLVREGSIMLATGMEETCLTGLSHIPFLVSGNGQPVDALAATGAAWALGLPADLIRAGLEIYGVMGNE